MKPELKRDFTLSVRYQTWEELPEVAELYRGIYSVSLNFLVDIMFVPEFTRTINNWPPELPEDIDKISTEEEARLFTLALSDYNVTPNTLLAGQQELIPMLSEPGKTKPQPGVIFYVKPEEFAVFSKELSLLAEKMMGVHDYVRISEVKNLEFAKFILSTVISSPNFSLNHQGILGRGK